MDERPFRHYYERCGKKELLTVQRAFERKYIMELYRFKLTPADRKASLNFLEINNKYKLFTTAAANCSNGVTFRHDGKKITVDEIAEHHLIITLSSVMPLAPLPQERCPPSAASC